MTSITIFTYATFAFFGTFLLFLASYVFRKEMAGRVAVGGTVLGWILVTGGLVLRTSEFSREMLEKMPEKKGALIYNLYYYFPVSNLYESLVFFAWTTILLYLWFDYRYKVRGMGGPVTLIASIIMAYAALWKEDGKVEPLIPALQSNWLTIHVITSFLAYACFAVSFGTSIYYLIASRNPDKSGAQRILLVTDNIVYKTIVMGFILLALGIGTGAAWADYAWGSYWSWDPKETWSLITWLVYAAFLHSRISLGWAGKKSAFFSIAGFAVTLFCYLGVNLVLSGLHSYGSGG